LKQHLESSKVAGFALLLCAAAAPSVHAQSTVSVYGLMDAYIEHRSNMTANGDGRWLVNSGGMNTSRVGFRGTEDLGGGLKALFQLESEVNVDTGQAAGGGSFWSRQANVGLEDSTLGRLVIGRSYSTTYDFLLPFDPMAYAPNYSWATTAGAAGGGATGGARKDGMVTGVSNLLKYRVALGPVMLGATHGLREGTGSKVWALAGSYSSGPLAFVLAWDRVEAAPVAAGIDKARSVHLGATYGVTDAVKLFAAIRDFKKTYAVAGAGGSKDESRTWWLGASFLATPALTLTAAYYKQDIRSGKTTGGINDPSLLALRARYALSKRTDLYTALGHGRADTGPVSISRDDAAFDTKQTGLTAGIQHRF
jgi:predicted porin